MPSRMLHGRKADTGLLPLCCLPDCCMQRLAYKRWVWLVRRTRPTRWQVRRARAPGRTASCGSSCSRPATPQARRRSLLRCNVTMYPIKLIHLAARERLAGWRLSPGCRGLTASVSRSRLHAA
jgi:hypothetical protein